jgi:hypothetical protein
MSEVSSAATEPAQFAPTPPARTPRRMRRQLLTWGPPLLAGALGLMVLRIVSVGTVKSAGSSARSELGGGEVAATVAAAASAAPLVPATPMATGVIGAASPAELARLAGPDGGGAFAQQQADEMPAAQTTAKPGARTKPLPARPAALPARK